MNFNNVNDKYSIYQYLGFSDATNFPNISDINDLGRTIFPSTVGGAGTANPPIYVTPYTNVSSPFFSNPNIIRNFQPIVVTYNSLTNNMLMGTTEGSLTFKAGEQITYDFERCGPNKFMCGASIQNEDFQIMGFDRATYNSFNIDLDNIPLQNVATPQDDKRSISLAIFNEFIRNLNGLILYSDANN